MNKREQLVADINKQLDFKKIERGETRRGEFFFNELNDKLKEAGLDRYCFKSYQSFINHITTNVKLGKMMNNYVAILLGDYLKVNIKNRLIMIAREELYSD